MRGDLRLDDERGTPGVVVGPTSGRRGDVETKREPSSAGAVSQTAGTQDTQNGPTRTRRRLMTRFSSARVPLISRLAFPEECSGLLARQASPGKDSRRSTT